MIEFIGMYTPACDKGGAGGSGFGPGGGAAAVAFRLALMPAPTASIPDAINAKGNHPGSLLRRIRTCPSNVVLTARRF